MSNFYNKISNITYPYIIDEIGSNHNGDMSLAKKLIDKAVEAGADCIKFQSWTKETIFSKKKYADNFFLKDDYRKRNDTNLEKIVDKYSISSDQLLELYNYCKDKNIDCTSTPFSHSEADFLVDTLDVPFIKVASMDLDNTPYLEYLSKKNKTIVLSTGLSTLEEIDLAVSTIEKVHKKIIILHCVAIYPCDDDKINLNNIDTLKSIYPYPIGFSDHSMGFSIPLASVVKGVCIIEKHFTLNKDMEGWDHKVSATPEELKIICYESKRIIDSFGTNRICVPEDSLRIQEFRRSIVTSREIKKNEIITEKDLDFKRPGIGIRPREQKFIVGRKAKFDIQKDEILYWNMLV
jgi:sialic acid synthase SpsE